MQPFTWSGGGEHSQPRRRTSFNRAEVLVPTGPATGSSLKLSRSRVNSEMEVALSRAANYITLFLGWMLVLFTFGAIFSLLQRNLFSFRDDLSHPSSPPTERLLKSEDARILLSASTTTTSPQRPRGLVILVMSARGNFEARLAIRETWAASESHVFFVVGKEACEVPPKYQSNLAPCELSSRFSWQYVRSEMRDHLLEEQRIQEQLEQESETFQDLVLLNIKDTYGNLAEKTKNGILWVHKRFPGCWFMKIDDDAIALVPRIKKHLGMLNPEQLRIIGETHVDAVVHKQGRWAELKFNATTYPTYVQGSTGYILSPKLVEELYKRRDKLELFRCEDAALGIWLHRLNLANRTIFDDDHRIRRDGNYKLRSCLMEWRAGRKFTYSHKLSPDDIRKCYAHLLTLERYGYMLPFFQQDDPLPEPLPLGTEPSKVHIFPKSTSREVHEIDTVQQLTDEKLS